MTKGGNFEVSIQFPLVSTQKRNVKEKWFDGVGNLGIFLNDTNWKTNKSLKNSILKGKEYLNNSKSHVFYGARKSQVFLRCSVVLSESLTKGWKKCKTKYLKKSFSQNFFKWCGFSKFHSKTYLKSCLLLSDPNFSWLLFALQKEPKR